MRWLNGIIDSKDMNLSKLQKTGKDSYENLDSVLKSRDVTLTTKVCILKAMVFPYTKT